MNLLAIDGITVFMALLAVVAFLYAAVGHGGASGYLALMALWSFPVSVMKPTALVLNLFVAAVSFISYQRKGYFNAKLFWSFAIASVPTAFLGGMIVIDAAIYKKILAVLLVFAILKMLGVFGTEKSETKEVPFWQGMIAGASIGLFSGMIGIGGGIILSPLILILGWGKMKEAAAVSAAFIWVNSAAGLIGHLSRGVVVEPQAFVLVAVAVAGGLAGGYLGSIKLNNLTLKRVLAFVLVIACAKLFLT
ncbi:MAG: sulfite exporter TauE/SafE family protein [Flavobacteriales bacterium]|nr:sulfite exporter TauE/SafE family protein [Flavobacteriales bacterium]